MHLECIDEARIRAIEQLLSGVDALLLELENDQNECSFECNAIHYGALSKELGARGLTRQVLQAPFETHSFEGLTAAFNSIQAVDWAGAERGCSEDLHDGFSRRFKCDLNVRMRDVVERAEARLLEGGWHPQQHSKSMVT